MASRNASFDEGGIPAALSAPVRGPAVATLVLLALMLVAWLIDTIMVLNVRPEGLARLQEILASDLDRAGRLASWCGAGSRLPEHGANLL